jgi:hypothetical protein
MILLLQISRSESDLFDECPDPGFRHQIGIELDHSRPFGVAGLRPDDALLIAEHRIEPDGTGDACKSGNPIRDSSFGAGNSGTRSRQSATNLLNKLSAKHIR